MPRLLRPFTRAVTYTRLLHLCVAVVWPAMLIFVKEAWWIWPVAAVVLLPAALVPAVRTVEGLQARLLLMGRSHDDRAAGIVVAPSATWGDRGRLAVWLQARLLLGSLTAAAVSRLVFALWDMAWSVFGARRPDGPPPLPEGALWWHVPLVALLLLVLLAVTVLAAGRLITALALRLLGPSPAERIAALEERTERLLERTRIARELHDSIGHALTVAVVQAGAARAAGDPAFTERALGAIEETGRAALEDLERVLAVLRESERPPGTRPALTDAGRLLASARASGTEVDLDMSGPLESVPGPVSREGYRILQEALTNVLRHAGPVPARVRVAVEDGTLTLDVRNALAAGPPGSGGGSGLRGIRERAALLGGRARTGPAAGEWRVHVELPVR
ncbi:two-component system sensor kinase [Streptomyces zinciresistens K42]|uniref:histidine kinase n=1 Tax=Streptomyces zinciresistens K42 TaxID=700597 RepID=G2GCP9_9ACTN|nr:histidine kinase [Streptomyces zinciresistens]EGX58710.1 two-component system sensor kinase [Streptomyces zinciresistens K42]